MSSLYFLRNCLHLPSNVLYFLYFLYCLNKTIKPISENQKFSFAEKYEKFITLNTGQKNMNKQLVSARMPT